MDMANGYNKNQTIELGIININSKGSSIAGFMDGSWTTYGLSAMLSTRRP